MLLTEIVIEKKLCVVQAEDPEIEQVEDQDRHHELNALIYLFKWSSSLETQALTIESLHNQYREVKLTRILCKL